MTETPFEQSPILSLQGVSKSFGGVHAVADLGFDVPRQGIFGLMGPNGAGKTTVLNLVSGFLKPDSGTIDFDGRDISRSASHRIGAIGIARTYQNLRMFAGLSVLEHVIAGLHLRRKMSLLGAVLLLPGERHARRQCREIAAELLERVGLKANHGARADTLSYGDQRRLEIARALATEPRLLLLDEPTAGMNSSESHQLGQLLLKLREEGVTLLLIEHNVELVLRYCETAAVMDFGRRLAVGKPEDCLQDAQVREAYFGKRANAANIERLIEPRQD